MVHHFLVALGRILSGCSGGFGQPSIDRKGLLCSVSFLLSHQPREKGPEVLLKSPFRRQETAPEKESDLPWVTPLGLNIYFLTEVTDIRYMIIIEAAVWPLKAGYVAGQTCPSYVTCMLYSGCW